MKAALEVVLDDFASLSEIFVIGQSRLSKQLCLG